MTTSMKIGNTSIAMRSYEGGTCTFYGIKRCKSSNKKLQAEEKKKSKSAKCKGKKVSCPNYCGASPFVPKFDEQYLLPANILETLVMVLADGNNALIAGPPGVGKSSVILQLAAILNWGCERYSCSEEITSSKIIGQWIVIEDTMKWVDGYITDAIKNGFILLEDEADFLRPELRGEVHSVMEEGGTITLTAIHPKTKEPFKEVIKKHPDFRWISTANTIGYGDDLFAFHGTQYMNAATRDRYDIILQVPHKEPDVEVAIVEQKTGIERAIAEKMVKVANDCRQAQIDGMLLQFSLRRLLSWAKFYHKVGPIVSSNICVLNFCNETDRHTVKSLIRTHLDIDTDSKE